MHRSLRRPHRRAFTLLELIVVIVILGILALLAIPTFGQVVSKSHYSGLEESGRALDHDAVAVAAFAGQSAAADSAAQAKAIAELPSTVTAGTPAGGQVTLSDAAGYSVCVTFGTAVNAYGTVTDGACSGAASSGTTTTTTTTAPAPGQAAYQAAVAQDAPLDFWTMADASGAPMTPAIGSDQGAYTSTGVTYQQAGPFNGASAVNFSSASSGYASVTVGSTPSAGGTWATWEGWVRWDGNTSAAEMVAQADSSGYGIDLVFDNNCLGFNSGHGDCYGMSDTAIGTGWLYLVAEFDNGNPAGSLLYINGQPQTLTQMLGTPYLNGVGANWRFGAAAGYSSLYSFNGPMSDVALYAGQLSPSRISAHYAAS